MNKTGPNKLILKVGQTPIPIIDVDGQVNIHYLRFKCTIEVTLINFKNICDLIVVM